MKTSRILVALVGAGLVLALVVIGVNSAAAEEAAVAREAAMMAPAATIVVTSTADSGPGTLRQALTDAVNGDVIGFDTSVFPPGNPQTITLASALPDITQGNLTIDASDAGVILDGSSIGTNVETQLFDNISLTIDSGPNLLVNGDFDAGMGHWRPFDERETPTRTLNTSDFQSAPNAFQWSGNARQSQSRTVYDPNDTSDPLSSWPFESGSSVWISATGSTATISLWYKDGLSSVGLWVLYSDNGTAQIAYWDLSQVTVWTTATFTYTLPGNAVAVALDLQHHHTEQWTSGLIIQSDGNTVSGLQIVGFPGNGIKLDENTQDNTIGGDRGVGSGPLGQGNLLSANGIDGVYAYRSYSNTISGNLIGTDLGGTMDWGNGATGVTLSGSAYNVIGGSNASPGGGCSGECNLISGNRGGVWIGDSNTMSNTISGNYIGTNISGTLALGNGDNGVQIGEGASHNLIGGDTAGERNLISGNGGNGVSVYDSNTMSNTVSGNYIGTDVNGTSALSNTYDGVSIGNGASYNLIGGDTPGERNLISGNRQFGIWVGDSNTMSNTISGNYIGADVSGTAALGNGWEGIWIGESASYNTVGGSTAGERNLISGNGGSGVQVYGSATMSNTVSGNYIGTDVSGTTALGNGQDGIWIGQDASYNTVGGSTAGERNLISGNYRVGVSINGEGNNTGHNVIQGNYIGTNISGTVALGNGWGDPYTAVEIYYTADNIIADNLISGNYGNGISFYGDTASGNVVRGNFIGTDVSGTLALGNGTTPNDGRWGITFGNSAHHNTIGGTSAGDRNVISGNGDLYCGPPELARADGGGIAIWDAAHDNIVQGNTIGMDVTGLTPIPNGMAGIEIYAASDNLIGGTAPGAGNLISGNSCDGPPPPRAGIRLGGDGNTIQGNIIGPDATGADVVSTHDNGWTGIWIVDAAGSLIEDNLIAGNGGSDGTGVYAWGTSTVSNTLTLNTIYGHGGRGIRLSGGANGYMFPPLLTEVSATSVKGFAVPGATVEVFSDDDDEGRWYHGSTTADGTGAFTFTTTFTGTNVTATATDSDGNTSEFSSPYHPSRDVIAAAIFVPQQRHAVNMPITPTVRVGNGGTAAETFTVTAVITRSSDGAQVYSATQVVMNLGVFNYRTLVLPAWTPIDLGSYAFGVCVQTGVPDDDTSNDCLTQAFVVADDRVDLWARDHPTDDGQEPSTGSSWQSPDVWVRNNADGGTTHQDPINTITNTVYLTVRNQGTLTATDVVATVYWHPPSLVIGQSWWQPVGTVTVTQLAPSATQVVSMAWPLNIAGLTGSYHTCLLGVLTTVGDPAPVMWDVRSSNNIVQRNVDVIPQEEADNGMDLDFAVSAAVSSTFDVGNPYPGEQLVDVIVDASDVPTSAVLWIDLGGLYERWEQMGQGSLVGATHVSGTTQITVAGGMRAEITGIPLAGEELVAITVEIYGLDPGESVQIDVSERIGGDVLGGITLNVTAVEHKIYLPLVLQNYSQ